MEGLGRTLPGAILMVVGGIAVGFLLELGAGHPPAPISPAITAPHSAGGEEPPNPSPPAREAPLARETPPAHEAPPARETLRAEPVPPDAPPPSPPPQLVTAPPAPPPAPALVATTGANGALAAHPPPPVASPQPLWRRNAVAFTLPARKPMIALVFDDLGLDRVHTAQVIRLPGPLTLSFLPYAHDLARQTGAAHASGHELLLHMPMEPLAAGLDPGPGALLCRLSPEEILKRLDHGLAAFQGYVGVNNHMGSRFTSSRTLMAPVLAELKQRGLLFLDSVTAGSSVAAEVAARQHLPHTVRNVFLDDELSAAAIRASLTRLEEFARRTGAAVAIGHPHGLTLEVVTPWLATLAAKGFVLAPLSAVVRARGFEHEEPVPASSSPDQSAGNPNNG